MTFSPAQKLAGAVVIVVAALYYVLFAAAVAAAGQNGVGPEDLVRGGNAGDASYAQLAKVMLSSQRFSFSESGPPAFFHTPGYPAFIAGIFSLTSSLVVVALVQILLTAFSAGLVVLIGMQFFSRAAALLAATFFALDPMNFLLSTTIYTESFFTFLFLLLIYGLLMAPRRSIPVMICLGLLAGYLVLTRPIAFFFIPLFIAGTALLRPLPWRNMLVGTGVFAAAMAVVIAPWAIRNHSLSGVAGISSIGAYNPLVFNIMLFETARRGITQGEFYADVNKRLGVADREELYDMKHVPAMRALVKEYFFAHPVSYSLFHTAKMLPYFSGSSIEITSIYFHFNGVLAGVPAEDVNLTDLVLNGKYRDLARVLFANLPVLFERLFWLGITASAIVYTLFLVMKRNSNMRIAILFLLCVFLYAFLTSTIFVPRYRMPVESLLFLVGFQGLVTLYTVVRSRLMRSSAPLLLPPASSS